MDLYYIDYSPPCRAVMLTAKVLGISLNKKIINLPTKEHLSSEFIAINPQHVIPTLIDGDLTLWESRAVCTYLVSKYGKDDALYPKDPNIRVLIDRLLYFDMGILVRRLADYYVKIAVRGEAPDQVIFESIHEALKWFNDYYLDGHNFCVGNNLTVADFCLVATVSSLVEAGIDMSKYPNITEWAQRCKSVMPGYESENGVGARDFGERVKRAMAEIKT
ncbi:UNVERIFIED_CONTAM: hypothetical protein RMT77_017498 [Armadillidium vulgare]